MKFQVRTTTGVKTVEADYFCRPKHLMIRLFSANHPEGYVTEFTGRDGRPFLWPHDQPMPPVVGYWCFNCEYLAASCPPGGGEASRKSAWQEARRKHLVAESVPGAEGKTPQELAVISKFSTLERAGWPHGGPASPEEQRLVKKYLPQINEQLRLHGKRTIDLDNKTHVERYGLQELVEQGDAKAKPGHQTGRPASDVESEKPEPPSATSKYSTLEYAGWPHRGPVSEEEQRLVREHLDEVNERLRRHGQRLIDVENEAHVKRYGLDKLPAELDSNQ